jgi:GWxTD domain-containing protein
MKVFFLIIFASVSLLAQKPQFDRASYYSYGQKLFAEAHTLSDNSKDSIKILVLFKSVYESLLFVQANPLDNPGSFQAIPSVEVFFKDESGIIKNRVLWTDTIWVNNYEDTKFKEKYSEGFIIAKLPINEYSCTIQLLDRYRKPSEKLDIQLKSKIDFTKNTIIGDPIFTYPVQQLPAYKSIPFILSNKVNFISRDAKIIIPVIYKKNYNVFNYTIKKEIQSTDIFWNDTINISGRVTPTDNSFVNLEKSKEFPVLLSIKSNSSEKSYIENSISGVMTIELPSSGLSPGNYSLLVINDNNTDSAKYEFEVIWNDMPLALRNPSYAVEVMYYILNDEEYSIMNSGNDDSKAQKVMKYWKQKDPTKLTPFNESMTEYFRRVDFAFFNYQTVKEKDGAKTERGKIYILFGKPDKVEKVLNDGKQSEVWTYTKQSKKYYFELVSNGLYILTKID